MRIPSPQCCIWRRQFDMACDALKVEKLLHRPTSRIGAAVENGRERDIPEAAPSLFGIDEDGAGKHVAK